MTLDGSHAWIVTCELSEDNIPADAGFLYDAGKGHWWTVRPSDAEKLVRYADEAALRKLGIYIKLDRPATCSSCSETIYYNKTKNGKWAPYNKDGTIHFSTCPNAAQHRKGSTKKGKEQKDHGQEIQNPERQAEFF